ncbi:hypothetical protein STSP2_01938 [Anaerohalosphaera lusitana]|uniref:Uncharacterized protein n=1 Tax=Anaerohalosphaera lusitana TaxID=1936003 RepID=A0A1U9NMN4_9BACT|nr:hypothetical protein STSP2_01938 [Anaerohalosphaera lusitana]
MRLWKVLRKQLKIFPYKNRYCFRAGFALPANISIALARLKLAIVVMADFTGRRTRKEPKADLSLNRHLAVKASNNVVDASIKEMLCASLAKVVR